LNRPSNDYQKLSGLNSKTASESHLTPPRIVVLSTQTLFAEGLVANLRQTLGQPGLQTLDPQRPEVLQQLVAYQPHFVLLDATAPGLNDHCLLDSLLKALPALTIIRLDPQQGQLQVVTSQQRTITRMSDMVAVIDALTQTTLAGEPSPNASLGSKEDAG
jgi:DNA-binding NarL/FixJ family response regulator